MPEKRLYRLILASLMAGLTAVLAFVYIPLPFSMVPVTGQTFGVMLAGAVLGPRTGSISQVVYVFLGVSGLPVFSGFTSGPGILAGPTGGYIWAFIPGAWLTGAITGNRPNFPRALIATVSGGIAVVYLIGVAQLMVVTSLTFNQAILVGAVPFIPGDLLKALAAAIVAVRLRPYIRMK